MTHPQVVDDLNAKHLCSDIVTVSTSPQSPIRLFIVVKLVLWRTRHEHPQQRGEALGVRVQESQPAQTPRQLVQKRDNLRTLLPPHRPREAGEDVQGLQERVALEGGKDAAVGVRDGRGDAQLAPGGQLLAGLGDGDEGAPVDALNFPERRDDLDEAASRVGGLVVEQPVHVGAERVHQFPKVYLEDMFTLAMEI